MHTFVKISGGGEIAQLPPLWLRAWLQPFGCVLLDVFCSCVWDFYSRGKQGRIKWTRGPGQRRDEVL